MKTLIVLNQSGTAISDSDFDYVIGVDGGCSWCIRQNIFVNLAVGDFDSLSETELNQLADAGTKIELHPAEKDFTDLELALNATIRLNPSLITVLGVWGGRQDHSLANLFCLARQTGQIPVVMPAKTQTGYLLKSQQRLTVLARPGSLLSILAMFNDCTDVSNKGMKYPLNKVTLAHGTGHGISNVMTEKQCEVSLKQGIMLVLANHVVEAQITAESE